MVAQPPALGSVRWAVFLILGIYLTLSRLFGDEGLEFHQLLGATVWGSGAVWIWKLLGAEGKVLGGGAEAGAWSLG